MTEWLTPAEFAARFLRRAASEARIAAALANLGPELKLGPIPGPLFTEALVHARIGRPVITPRAAPLVQYDVALPVSLDLVLRVTSEVRGGGDVTVHLVLTARAVAPLHLFIEIAPLAAEDLRIRLRAEGPLGGLARTLGGFDREIRRQLANRINARLADPAAVARRTIDIGARVDGEPADPDQPLAPLSDAEFGTAFLRRAVSERRLRAALERLRDREATVGPRPAGPGDVAQVTARAVVGLPTLTPAELDATFRAVLPVAIDMSVALGGGRHTLRGTAAIPLRLAARATAPLQIVVDVVPVQPAEITLDLRADGPVAALIKRLGGVAGQLRAELAGAVNQQIATSEAARTVDVGARVDAAG